MNTAWSISDFTWVWSNACRKSGPGRKWGDITSYTFIYALRVFNILTDESFHAKLYCNQLTEIICDHCESMRNMMHIAAKYLAIHAVATLREYAIWLCNRNKWFTSVANLEMFAFGQTKKQNRIKEYLHCICHKHRNCLWSVHHKTRHIDILHSGLSIL